MATPLAKPSQLRVKMILFCLWAVMVTYLISRHAIWADEARAWLIATRTPDWTSLFEQTHTDGHPVLWYIILRLASYLHGGLTTLYVVHFAFAAIAVGFCLALKNIPLVLRCMLVLGGILGFEYAVIARNYAPAAAALFAYAYFYPRKEERPWLLGLLLALALNFHAGLAPIIPFLLLPWLVDSGLQNRKSFLIASIIVALGYIVLALSIFPPDPDSIYTIHKLIRPRGLFDDLLPAKYIFSMVTFGFEDIGNFWFFLNPILKIILTFIFLGMLFLLYTTPIMRVAAIGLFVATTLFYGLNYPVPVYRHNVMLVIAWLSLLAIEGATLPRPTRQKIGLTLIGIILFLQFGRLISGVYIPASASAVIANTLSKPDYKNAEVFCIPEWVFQSLAASGLRSCQMAFLNRNTPYPTFRISEYIEPSLRWYKILEWMRTTEQKGYPALLYIQLDLLPKETRTPEESGRLMASGRRFRVMGADAEIDQFLLETEIIETVPVTLSPERTALLRLKPEYRGARSPSALPHKDP